MSTSFNNKIKLARKFSRQTRRYEVAYYLMSGAEEKSERTHVAIEKIAHTYSKRHLIHYTVESSEHGFAQRVVSKMSTTLICLFQLPTDFFDVCYKIFLKIFNLCANSHFKTKVLFSNRDFIPDDVNTITRIFTSYSPQNK